METIELSKDDNFFIRFAPDKINMNICNNESREHYTLSFGLRSKILDVHRTIDGKIDATEKKHRGKVYLRHFSLGRVLVLLKRIEPIYQRFFVNSQVPISVLIRLGLTLLDIGKEEAQELIKIDKNGTRFKPKKVVPKKEVESLFNCTCQIRKVSDIKGFIAYRKVRGGLKFYGWVYAFPQRKNPKRVILITERKIKSFLDKHLVEIKEILDKEMTLENQSKMAIEVENVIYKTKQNQGNLNSAI